MRDDDKREFLAALAATLSVYGKEVDRTQAAVWFASLQTYSLASVRQGLTAHLADPDSGQYPPKPADVVRHIEGSAEAKAVRAWDKTLSAIRSAGGYDSVVFDDPIIHAVLRDMGGWVACCEWEEDVLPFREKDFAKRYAAYAGRCGEYPPVMIGRINGDLQRRGLDVEAPKLIGEPDKCRAVIDGGMAGAGRAIEGPQTGQTLRSVGAIVTGNAAIHAGHGDDVREGGA